jgi:hypothetical protein
VSGLGKAIARAWVTAMRRYTIERRILSVFYWPMYLIKGADTADNSRVRKLGDRSMAREEMVRFIVVTEVLPTI